MKLLKRTYPLMVLILIIIGMSGHQAFTQTTTQTTTQANNDPLFYLYPEMYVQALDCDATCSWQIRQMTSGPFGWPVEMKPIPQSLELNYGPEFFRSDWPSAKKTALRNARTTLLNLCREQDPLATITKVNCIPRPIEPQERNQAKELL